LTSREELIRILVSGFKISVATLILVSLFVSLILLSGITTGMISGYSSLFRAEASIANDEPSDDTDEEIKTSDTPKPKHDTDKDGTSDDQDTDDDNDNMPDDQDTDDDNDRVLDKNEVITQSNADEKPTLSECRLSAAIKQPIAMPFVAACLIFYPNVFKSEGGTLVYNDDYEAEGIPTPFK
jgi:hypothetical protein